MRNIPLYLRRFLFVQVPAGVAPPRQGQAWRSAMNAHSRQYSITHDMSAAVSAWLHSWHCISMRQSVSSSEIESLLSQINRDLTVNRLVYAYRDPRVPSRVPPRGRAAGPACHGRGTSGTSLSCTRAYQLTTPRGAHSAKPRRRAGKDAEREYMPGH
jgi:hypothetical protein